jgi:hypothetical protein
MKSFRICLVTKSPAAVGMEARSQPSFVATQLQLAFLVRNYLQSRFAFNAKHLLHDFDAVNRPP